jgi:hypothetical protein
MKQNLFYSITGIIFSLIAAIHLLRIFYGWDAVIGGWSLPMWPSWLAVIIAVFIAYNAFKLKK